MATARTRTALLLLLAFTAGGSCTLDRRIPAHLTCKSPSDCPSGYKCTADQGQMHCCPNGVCPPPGGEGTGSGGSPAGAGGAAGGAGRGTGGGAGTGTAGAAGGAGNPGTGGGAGGAVDAG